MTSINRIINAYMFCFFRVEAVRERRFNVLLVTIFTQHAAATRERLPLYFLVIGTRRLNVQECSCFFLLLIVARRINRYRHTVPHFGVSLI